MIDDGPYFEFLRDPTPEKWRAAVAAADRFVVVVANKFDPSEPRDEAGRWTFAGETSVSTANRGPEWARPTLDAFARDHPDTRVDLPGDVRRTEIMDALTQLDLLMTRFPQVPINSIFTAPLASMPPMRVAQYDPVSKSIELSPIYWRTPWADTVSLYREDKGWHPDGTSNPTGYVTHEFGHAVMDYLAHEAPAGGVEFAGYSPITGIAGDQTSPAWVMSHPVGITGFSGPVSGYGATNGQEAFAEAFSQAYTYPDSVVGESFRTALAPWLLGA